MNAHWRPSRPSPIPPIPFPLPHAITQLYPLVAKSRTWFSNWAGTHAFFSADLEHLCSLSVQPSSCLSFSLHSVWTPFITFSNFKPQVRHPVPLVTNSLIEFLQPHMSWAWPGLCSSEISPTCPKSPDLLECIMQSCFLSPFLVRFWTLWGWELYLPSPPQSLTPHIGLHTGEDGTMKGE